MRHTLDTEALAHRYSEKAAQREAEAQRLREYEEQQRRAHENDSDDGQHGALIAQFERPSLAPIPYTFDHTILDFASQLAQSKMEV